MSRVGTPPGRTEKCPGCGDDIVLRMNQTDAGVQPTAYTTNGQLHYCPSPEVEEPKIPVKKPIGDLVKGQTIIHFQVRERRMTLRFASGSSLDVNAKDYAPLRFRITEADGNLVEE